MMYLSMTKCIQQYKSIHIQYTTIYINISKCIMIQQCHVWQNLRWCAQSLRNIRRFWDDSPNLKPSSDITTWSLQFIQMITSHWISPWYSHDCNLIPESYHFDPFCELGLWHWLYPIPSILSRHLLMLFRLAHTCSRISPRLCVENHGRIWI